MTRASDGDDEPGRQARVMREVARRRRLDEVFGEVSEQTVDDRPGGDESPTGRGDAWLREQVPPHHGG